MDGRTENRTPISYLAKAGATKIPVYVPQHDDVREDIMYRSTVGQAPTVLAVGADGVVACYTGFQSFILWVGWLFWA